MSPEYQPAGSGPANTSSVKINEDKLITARRVGSINSALLSIIFISLLTLFSKCPSPGKENSAGPGTVVDGTGSVYRQGLGV
jgi:hypothetical protein